MTKAKETGKAILALESGRVFIGESFGAAVERVGEVVFNTSMTGYQEILTDPSYKGQIIVMTEPHIGNVGINAEDAESSRIFAEGLVVREISPLTSNWRSQESLPEFLKSRKIPGIAGIDTRALTKHLRESGAMRGILSTQDSSPESLLAKVRKSPSMSGSDLVKEVTCGEGYPWVDPEWEWREPAQAAAAAPTDGPRVTVIDYGIKHNILRCLSSRGCRLTVLPAQATPDEILATQPDGLFLSNGPGDPAAVTYAVKNLREIIERQLSGKIAPLPTFGICLGHQLLGLALGGTTFKLKFGHRGSNHPVKDLKTGKIEITSQNHGFCVDIDSLSDKDVQITHVNLNDNTLEGMKHKKLPLASVQYHPESSAGPHDSRYLFDRFMDMIKAAKKKN